MFGNYKESFPDFGELDVVLPAHLKDVSWSNEPCPCFHSDEARVFLYVDYVELSRREFPETERFILQAAGEDGQHLADEKCHLLATDDLALVLETIEARRVELAPRSVP